MGYAVVEVDLTTTFENKKIFDQAQQVGSVTVTNLPSGAVCKFRVGNQPFVTARDGLQIDNLDPRAEGNLGVFAQNATAQPGTIVEFFIGLAPTTPGKV